MSSVGGGRLLCDVDRETTYETTHAMTMGYRKLSGLLKPDTAVLVPFQFKASGLAATDKLSAEYFLRLMKALLKSGVWGDRKVAT